MKKTRKSPLQAPPLGTVFYEVGFKREEPCAPVIISWIYGGTVLDHGREFHLLVEFSRGWNRERLEFAVKTQAGLKIPTLEQLYEGRERWEDVLRWTKACGMNWRSKMER